MYINLTFELKSALESHHSKAQDGRDRIKMFLLRSQGWTIAMIAQALSINESINTRHQNDFVDNQKPKPENGSPRSYLNTAQTEL